MTNAEETRPGTDADSHDPGIDIEKLADMVYRIMRDDVRLERARGARAPRPGTR